MFSDFGKIRYSHDWLKHRRKPIFARRRLSTMIPRVEILEHKQLLTTIIGFDDLIAGTQVYGQYQSEGANFDGTAVVVNQTTSFPAHSGTKLALNYGQSINITPTNGTWAQVGGYVSSGQDPIELVAYNSYGNVLGAISTPSTHVENYHLELDVKGISFVSFSDPDSSSLNLSTLFSLDDFYFGQNYPISISSSIDNSLQGIHHILYEGQSLSVPLVISNTGSTPLSGNVNVSLYLSSNSQQSIGSSDILVASVPNQEISAQVGKSARLSLNAIIPSKTASGSYYIKAVISPGSQNSIGIFSSVTTVSPTLNEYDATAMVAGTPALYEAAVSIVKANPSILPTEFATGLGDVQIQNYIKDNEGSSLTPYIDSQGYPTIGYGFNLDNSSAPSRLVALGLNYNLVLQQAQANGSQLNVSGGYNNTIKQKVTQAVIQGWFSQDYPAAKTGLLSSLTKFGITSSQYGEIAITTQIALIDMYYNMGDQFINGPPGKAFTKMLGFIKTGNMAAAGFELMNSTYLLQVKTRATKNFELLVYGNTSNL